MGSLIVAGALQGLGGGIARNAEHMAEEEQNQLDRDHDKALETMRSEAAMNRQTQQQGYLSDQYDLTRTHALEDYETQQEDAMSAATATRQWEGTQNRMDRENEIFIQAMKMFQEETTGGKSLRSVDGKWDMQTVIETSADGFTQEERLVVREPGSPMILGQFGNYMLPEGQTDEQREQALAAANSSTLKKAEKDLLGKAGKENDDSSEFLEAYGYLPVSYFRKKMQSARGAEGFSSYYRRFRSPAGMPSNAPASKPRSEAAPAATPSVMEEAEAAAGGPVGPPGPTPKPELPPAVVSGADRNTSPGYDPTQRNVPIPVTGSRSERREAAGSSKYGSNPDYDPFRGFFTPKRGALSGRNVRNVEAER